jgi:hypothetical protein
MAGCPGRSFPATVDRLVIAALARAEARGQVAMLRMEVGMGLAGTPHLMVVDLEVGVGETRGEVHHLLKGMRASTKPVGKAAFHTACRRWMGMNLC